MDQSVSSFWKRSANGTVATSIVAPVIALNSSPRCSSRPAMTGPGRVRMLTVTPSCFICAFAAGVKAAAVRAAAPNVAAARERLMVISWPPVFQCFRQAAGFRHGVRLPCRGGAGTPRAALLPAKHKVQPGTDPRAGRFSRRRATTPWGAPRS